jgi:hypothetical protein
MRRLVLFLVLPALLLGAPQVAVAESLLPPLPHSRLMDRALLETEHGPSVRPLPPFRSGFSVKEGKYHVGVSTYGGGLFLGVWRGGLRQRSMTAYLAKGVAQPEHLQATFGKFGEVKMRFRRSRNRPPDRVCIFGRTLVWHHGVFVGNFRFRGEGGYVSVRLHRAKGTILREGGRCHVRRRHHDFDPSDFEFLFAKPEAAMLAIDREGVNWTGLLALAAKKNSTFLAVHEESRGKLAIVRLATVHKAGTLHFDEALTTGRLVPPDPFHGSGRYSAAPDGTQTWAGNLSVNFPGAPRYPLTGPGYEAFVEVPF